jgi:spore maturation protein CgeB
MKESFDIVILGLSITSSWGNGHATTYRSLVGGLERLGHRVLFLECDVPWYAANRDQPQPHGATTKLYENFDDLIARFEQQVQAASLVIVGSFVPDGARVGEWVTSVARGRTAFYDIDTPITLEKLANGEADYLRRDLIPKYDCYLSFTGGPILQTIERYGSPMARVLYCSVDVEHYRPLALPRRWELGYLGTYSEDRQSGLEDLLLQPARQWENGCFAVAGSMYPPEVEWPSNVERITHIAPLDHPAFYRSQKFTLNLTRARMKEYGFSPSVRLFEAGACATPIISDWWTGFDSLFRIGHEILVARDAEDTLRYLREVGDDERLAIGEAARTRVLAEHTPQQRALQLEGYLEEMNDNVSAHSSRRHRRHRPLDRGLDAGLASEHSGTEAGGDARSTTGSAAGPGNLHQSTGASR